VKNNFSYIKVSGKLSPVSCAVDNSPINITFHICTHKDDNLFNWQHYDGKDWTPFTCSANDESYTSAGMTLSPMTKFSAVLVYLKSHSLFTNKDSVYSATLPDSHTPYQPICTKVRDGKRPSQEWSRACGRPPTTWIHQISVTHTGVTATEALQLAEDRPFWRLNGSCNDDDNDDNATLSGVTIGQV